MLGEGFEVACSVCDLGVDELGEGTDELRGCVEVGVEARFVDELANGVPEGRFEALGI